MIFFLGEYYILSVGTDTTVKLKSSKKSATGFKIIRSNGNIDDPAIENYTNNGLIAQLCINDDYLSSGLVFGGGISINRFRHNGKFKGQILYSDKQNQKLIKANNKIFYAPYLKLGFVFKKEISKNNKLAFNLHWVRHFLINLGKPKLNDGHLKLDGFKNTRYYSAGCGWSGSIMLIHKFTQ